MLEILCYSFCFLLFGLHFYAEDFPHGKLINTAYIHNGYLSVILCINLATFRNDGYLILTYLTKSSLIANKIAIISVIIYRGLSKCYAPWALW